MTPLEYRNANLPLPTGALVISRQLTRNDFVKVNVTKINKKTVVIEHPKTRDRGSVSHDDITMIGEIELQ